MIKYTNSKRYIQVLLFFQEKDGYAKLFPDKNWNEENKGNDINRIIDAKSRDKLLVISDDKDRY